MTTDLLTMLALEAQAADRAAKEAEDSATAARLQRDRATLAEYLRPQMWQALGMDPLQATVSRDILALESNFEVEGHPMTVRLSAERASHGLRYVYLRLSQDVCARLTHNAPNPAAQVQNEKTVGAAILSRLHEIEAEKQRAYHYLVERWRSWLSTPRTVAEYEQYLEELRTEGGLQESDSATFRSLAKQHLATARQREAKREALRAQALLLLGEVCAAAHAQQAEEVAYQEACRVWVERWTADLWEPHHLLRVVYTAPNVAELIAVCQEADEEVDLDTLTLVNYFLPGEPDAAGFYQLVSHGGGHLTPTRLQAIVREEQITFTTPCTTDCLLGHSSHRVGAYTLNIPAHVQRRPTDSPPTAPQPWYERIAPLREELGAIGAQLHCNFRWHLDRTSLERFLIATPEELLDGFFN